MTEKTAKTLNFRFPASGITRLKMLWSYLNAKIRMFFRIHLLQLKIFESFDDGIIIINKKDKIIYLNSVAEEVVGISAQDAYGLPLDQIMAAWKGLSLNPGARVFEYKGSVNFNGIWRYYSVRLSTLRNKRGKEVAKAILLRDTTDRKNINELRKKTRDEMFTFLRSLFNSTNASTSQTEFCQNSLYQIAYTFHIDQGAFFLAEPTRNKKIEYTLSAKVGTLLQNKAVISRLYEMLETTIWPQENNQPFVSDTNQDSSLLKYIDGFDYCSLAAFPLIADDQLFGVLIFARTQMPGFSADEITRLTVVSDELASLLDAEKKKRSNIALAERQHLIRDLHDSITQKLYGMVMLTDFVQLGMQTGTVQDVSEQMAKIGENARQSLREMRLFLYELEPVDIEKDGLVFALRRRIDSVESRSGLRARVISDEDILLPSQKELALYFIAQEALNNVLKHANANSLLIKIKRRKDLIYLQVIDDGIGFSLDEIDKGGLGIKNMQARAKEIDAKMKIITTPGKGTKITVSLAVR